MYCDVDAALDTSFGSSSHDWYAGGSRPDAELLNAAMTAATSAWICAATESSTTVPTQAAGSAVQSSVEVVVEVVPELDEFEVEVDAVRL